MEKQVKKQPDSLRTKLLRIILLCWVLPIAIILTVAGIVIGIPAGIGILQYLLTALAAEYELKLVLGPATWLISILLTFGVSLVVGLMVARKNRHIDMVAALKTEE